MVNSEKEVCRVFVVDDNELHIEIIERMLKRKGYWVKTFSNGYRLLDQLKTDQPHLIISDIEMPEINGFDLYEEIKKLPDIDIPLLYISSMLDQSIKKQVNESGAAGFIQKPIVPKTFLKMVSKNVSLL